MSKGRPKGIAAGLTSKFAGDAEHDAGIQTARVHCHLPEGELDSYHRPRSSWKQLKSTFNQRDRDDFFKSKDPWF